MCSFSVTLWLFLSKIIQMKAQSYNMDASDKDRDTVEEAVPPPKMKNGGWFKSSVHSVKRLEKELTCRARFL